MIGLFISLALLGLAAIDPVGIAVMPILLVQERPYRRAAVFLSGSFLSLMLMGLLFAKGLGHAVLRFEDHNSWFVPSVEALAGAVLLIIALVLYVQLRMGKSSLEPSAKTRRWLKLNDRHLFLAGAALVAVQSVLDVVFVVAMVRTGQFRLSGLTLSAAVATYAVFALVLQFAVVAAFRLAPTRQKEQTLRRVQGLLARYSNQALIAVSAVLSCLLIALAIRG